MNLFLKVLLVLIGPFLYCLTHTHAQDSVALIIGGHNETELQTDTAELFGCPGQPGSIVVNQFPNYTYMAGGIWDEDAGMALVCGGFSCQVSKNKSLKSFSISYLFIAA